MENVTIVPGELMEKRVEVVRDFVGSTKIFSVKFIKKDGSERLMNCRRGVKKDLKGVGLGYNAIEKNLLSVYDIVKKDYRMINISTIKELRANKQVILFE
jgi:hypothetical protein